MAGARVMRGSRQRLRECNQSRHRAASTGLSGTHPFATIATAAGTGSRIRARAGDHHGTGTLVAGAKLRVAGLAGVAGLEQRQPCRGSARLSAFMQCPEGRRAVDFSLRGGGSDSQGRPHGRTPILRNGFRSLAGAQRGWRHRRTGHRLLRTFAPRQSNFRPQLSLSGLRRAARPAGN